jgi:uncharacterized membrane protein
MQSLRDTFLSFNVPNLAVRIEPVLLDKIATPLIVYLNSSLGYATVEKVESDFVEWFHNDLGAFKEPLTEFSRKWQGVSLVLEPTNLSGDKYYTRNRLLEIYEKLRKPFGLFAAVLILTIWISGDPKTSFWTYNSLILIHISGIVISIILIRDLMNKYENFWRKDRRLNFPGPSERVLKSELAKTPLGINWPEISLIYFTGGLLLLLTSKSPESPATTLKLLNYGALICALWLIYIQFKLRSACILCLVISCLLIGELFALAGIKTVSNFNGNDARQFILSFLIPVIVWLFIKRPIESVSVAKGHFYTIKKMMFDPVYVRSLLAERKISPSFFYGMQEITLGNTAAKNCITLVLSPICNMCRSAFLQAQKLVSENPGIKCEIILAVSPNPESIDHIVTTSILGSPAGKETEALSDWYQNMPEGVEKWIKDRNPDLIKGSEQLTHHSRWYELAGLHSDLPIILLNGAELPTIYNISDVKRILSFQDHKELVRQ